MIAGTAALFLVGAVVAKFVDFSKYVRNSDLNGALTQLYTWVVSVVAVVLFAKSGLAEDLILPFSDKPFENYSGIAQVLVGLTPGSLGSIFVDYKKARDNNDSASTQSLFS